MKSQDDFEKKPKKKEKFFAVFSEAWTAFVDRGNFL